mmetsp:Transcript_41508/g.115408  ORF Transcript_41508/g.115408 Transcript_41508/m.115408 type:complete len:289 (+) Transcript_41508:1488-2354(+)
MVPPRCRLREDARPAQCREGLRAGAAEGAGRQDHHEEARRGEGASRPGGREHVLCAACRARRAGAAAQAGSEAGSAPQRLLHRHLPGRPGPVRCEPGACQAGGGHAGGGGWEDDVGVADPCGSGGCPPPAPSRSLDLGIPSSAGHGTQAPAARGCGLGFGPTGVALQGPEGAQGTPYIAPHRRAPWPSGRENAAERPGAECIPHRSGTGQMRPAGCGPRRDCGRPERQRGAAGGPVAEEQPPDVQAPGQTRGRALCRGQQPGTPRAGPFRESACRRGRQGSGAHCWVR